MKWLKDSKVALTGDEKGGKVFANLVEAAEHAKRYGVKDVPPNPFEAAPFKNGVIPL